MEGIRFSTYKPIIMKIQPIIFQSLALLLILTLGLAGCKTDEVDQLIPQQEISNYEVPELPDDFVRHFTTEQLEAFRSGPKEKVTTSPTAKKNKKWRPIIVHMDELVYSSPLLSPCADPQMVICDDPPVNCPNPMQWTGVFVHTDAEGIWKGVGKITGRLSGVICQPSGTFYQVKSSLFKKNSGLHAYGDDVQLVSSSTNSDGVDVSTWQITFTDGTGIFEDGHGWCTTIVYSYSHSNPFSGEAGVGEYYSLGWAYF